MTETVHEYSKIAAQSFIQTSVFIDDRIYMDPIPEPDDRNAEDPNERPQAIEGEPLGGDYEEGVGDYEVEDPLTGIAIVNSFAAKQIVCSLYRPENDNWQAQTRDIIKVCNAADVVILDWDLFGHIGDRACELIDKIISDSIRKTPERLRLFLVYAYKSDLFGIANDIHRKVPFIHRKCDPLEEETDPDFQADNYRVVVRQKKTRATVDATSPHIIGENELADVAIEEFAKLASGLLQSTILRGLAEIQNNSWKILSRFNHQLDPAFLTHLAMSKPEEDALSHIVPLLVSEIESVLEDALPRPLMSDNLLKDWCVNVWEPGDHLDQIFTGQRLSDQQVSGLDRKRIATDICEAGFEVARKRHNLGTAGQPKYAIPDLSKARNAIKASKMLLPSNESKANERLAQLMASRTFYGKNKKTLELGCILFRRFDEQYLMCIQPVCDSVRLEDQTVFIFVELKVANAADEHPVSHIIVDGGDNVIKLLYDPKPKSCYTAIFERDSRSKQVVAKEENDELYFEDMDDNKYDWKDQLRTSHAQRAVEQFARYLSRVGLTESEWLRRLGKG